MKILDSIAFIIVLIGAANWGLIGFFDFNLVSTLFGDMSGFTRIIYGLVGLSGIYCLSFFAKKQFANIK
jgi:uncharacterized membrane protein YuzA (DUF378 family)